MNVFGAIDLGGTAIKAAAIDENGNVLCRVEVPTRVDAGCDAVVERMAAALDEASGTAHLAAVGVGVPGLVDADGTILRFPNFADWDGFALGAALRQRLGRPTVIENDANAAAVAEGFAGAARGHRDYLLVTLGTGVGGGLVLGNRLWRGGRSHAAELGHVKVDPDGRPCGCGGRGCVESYASGPAVVQAAGRAIAAGTLGPPPDGVDLSPAWLQERAAAGDATAAALFTDAGRWLGLALSAAVNLLDVTAFFLGGGVAGAFQLLAPALRTSLLDASFGLAEADLVIERASCGNDAGLIGCGRLAALVEPSKG